MNPHLDFKVCSVNHAGKSLFPNLMFYFPYLDFYKTQCGKKKPGLVPVYDWASFLGQYFRKVPNIKKYQHFRFSKDEPGIVYFKENRSSAEQSLMLLKDPAVFPPRAVLPGKIHPEGMTDDRKRYLYREIRQFYKQEPKILLPQLHEVFRN